MAGPTIGIGSALRKAREHRAKTVEEAARDTKIRAEYLLALERESFEALLGDVYVRGFLRSYSQYLGLDPEKVVTAYTRSVGEPKPSEPPVQALRPDPSVPQTTFRSGALPGNWIIAGGIAAILLILAAAFGFLSRSRSTPPVAALPSTAASAVAPEKGVTVSLLANKEIFATVTIDGVRQFSGILHAKEARSFQGSGELSVAFAKGGSVDLTVNGKDLGTPGDPTKPYSQTFSPGAPK